MAKSHSRHRQIRRYSGWLDGIFAVLLFLQTAEKADLAGMVDVVEGDAV
jgi:hypothetical protein